MRLIFLITFSIIAVHSFGQLPSKLDTITTTTIRPYNKICYLHIYREHPFNKDSWYQSTGFFIAPNVILTAAHNIHSTKGSKVTHITVVPGKYYNDAPFDSIDIDGYDNCFKAIKTHPKYSFISKKRINWDFGIIILPQMELSKNSKFDKKMAFVLDKNYLLKMGDTLYVAGYPADPAKNYHGDFMTFQEDTCRGVWDQTFSHQFDTFTGNSGSPIWVNSNGKRIVVGVHTFSEAGTKLNKEDVKMISDWIYNISNTK